MSIHMCTYYVTHIVDVRCTLLGCCCIGKRRPVCHRSTGRTFLWPGCTSWLYFVHQSSVPEVYIRWCSPSCRLHCYSSSSTQWVFHGLILLLYFFFFNHLLAATMEQMCILTLTLTQFQGHCYFFWKSSSSRGGLENTGHSFQTAKTCFCCKKCSSKNSEWNHWTVLIMSVSGCIYCKQVIIGFSIWKYFAHDNFVLS